MFFFYFSGTLLNVLPFTVFLNSCLAAMPSPNKPDAEIFECTEHGGRWVEKIDYLQHLATFHFDFTALKQRELKHVTYKDDR